MKGMLEKLPDNFIRVHRSYIVPINRIEKLRKKAIKVSHHTIPIGPSYREDFEKAMKNG